MADAQGKPPRKPRSKPRPKPRPKPRRGTGRGYEPPEKGEAVEGHAEYVARHFGGGVEATPEILDRAIEVWQRLPGSVVRGPAQIRPNRPAAPPRRDDEDKDAAS